MITTIVNVCSTPVSFYTIERYGRRPLLIYGAVMMAICEFTVAAVWDGRRELLCGKLRPHRLRMPLHFLLRLDMGPGGVGCNWRDFPAANPCKRRRPVHCKQLVLELHYRHCHTLLGRPWHR